MILKAERIADHLAGAVTGQDPLVISPLPDLDELRSSGSGAIDLRLGTWFTTLRRARMPALELEETREAAVTKTQYVRFGGDYYLHPRSFVLGVTLEWIRLPADLAGYVVGRSSWGRRGLIIATAIGVHPGFTGCLTLELANVGEMPIPLKPGMRVCQLFLHEVQTKTDTFDQSRFVAMWKPRIGRLEVDERAKLLWQ